MIDFRDGAVRTVLLVLGVAFLTGLAFGGWLYMHRDPQVAGFVGWTAAWPQHAAVAAIGAALVVYVVRHRWQPRRPALTALRITVALPLLGLLVFAAFRAGVQVLAGLDPNFTVNAWGGPSYLGAMACHYLDLAVGAIVVAGLLRLILTQRAASAA
ncbi:putative protein OS=Tsukamurella paurometabola (strain ATCC 8368 / DSM / CCUG 35730 /CIP 100753 / JCM 10117 / KCTC 9821 / NBRC 16120 / NCIMB 702349/ NCTC 13040) OX=521096 GN=Tpau_3239 PE=4 SV=1 [Tsukamurella paurometabola]|uniref:Uncharacterized protein n=1 Tax=Tsukamurella paurometabola (strain ATCC 8368 / DSM 20162 / CCUG 35730 / CIP 100753 / JCM 10117 / KCTC 9821 / NBRC 16120 / NCIMB 702349 / NCTC 13040) TaxID=521096 RepID=D5UVP2_TSUPD|nr:hypothetical protein [Tsukamurella paurometabola]ADG79824.1 hypothetical protein Tpau_3239 [Tsukamurella paurometabola DSM 20162]SUP37345.1 Uncharacterised protein [Tsukamurella paurometabola]